MSSASSTSGYSDSTSGHSPPASFDAFDNASFSSPTRYTSRNEEQSTRSSQSTTVDCVSLQAIQSAQSPSAHSNHSYHTNHRNSIVSIPEHLPSHHESPVTTPPELSQSSSSPTPGAQYFDLEGASESEHGGDSNDIDIGNEDIFLRDFSNNLNHLDQDSDMMLMNKFADAFGATANTNEMFGTLENDDVFFGSA